MDETQRPSRKLREEQRRPRVFTVEDLEVRDGTSDTPARIIGHPVVYDRWSEDLGGFREKIMPGALTKTLLESDIRVLFNHDPNFVLGRNRSGTATFTDQATSLRMECTPPDTQTVRDLVLEPMRRGDINQMSFSFLVTGPAVIRSDKGVPKGTGEVWNEDMTEREIHQARMFDGSVVTFPAYPQTDAAVRSNLGMLERVGIDWTALDACLYRQERGLPATANDRELLETAVLLLRSYIPEPEPEATTQEAQQAEPMSIAHLRALLEMEAASA